MIVRIEPIENGKHQLTCLFLEKHPNSSERHFDCPDKWLTPLVEEVAKNRVTNEKEFNAFIAFKTAEEEAEKNKK